MFQFPPFASTHLCIQCGMIRVRRIGFPHSEISGLTSASDYPKLNAANHALHRLLAPRHSPYALISLTIHLPLANGVITLSVLGVTLTDSIVKEQFRHKARNPRRKLSFAVGFGLSEKNGGAKRARTADFRLAKAALSQLSYSPAQPLSCILQRAVGDLCPHIQSWWA